jgi:hypothetical protein
LGSLGSRTISVASGLGVGNLLVSLDHLSPASVLLYIPEAGEVVAAKMFFEFLGLTTIRQKRDPINVFIPFDSHV